MKNNYFVLLVILLTWHFLQSRVQSCHRFKGRGSRTLLVFSSLASCTAIHTDGSYTVKRQKKSAESGKHIDNPVHQTILHFLYAPFISDKKAAERFMPKWFPQLSCSSLGRWLKCWATLSRGPLHPPVLPYRAGRDPACSSSDKLISSISWVIFGSLDEVKDPVVTESWRDKSLSVFPWTAVHPQKCLFFLSHPKWAGWEDVPPSFSWALCTPLTSMGETAVLGALKCPK